MAKPKGALSACEKALRAHALGKPEATEHFPWGERAIKVKGKVFLFMYADAERLSLSCKLPQSSDDALGLPFVAPTEYGLGKSGWVTARLEAGPVPVDMFKAWIDESYRAQAPKRLVAALVAGGGTAGAASADAVGKPRPALGKKRTAKKRVVKKAAKKAAKRARSAASAQPRAPRTAKKQRKSGKSTARPRRAG